MIITEIPPEVTKQGFCFVCVIAYLFVRKSEHIALEIHVEDPIISVLNKLICSHWIDKMFCVIMTDTQRNIKEHYRSVCLLE